MVWDFDKTLIRDYMQVPLFKRYGIDSKQFWDEVNALPEFYAKKGIHINRDTSYLNHILTYVKAGKMRGLSNQILRDCGKELELFPGLPEFFPKIKSLVEEKEKFQKAGIKLEHYVVSTGFAETIRGSAVAPYLDGIFGCEFIEEPAQPGFLTAAEKALDGEISHFFPEIFKIGQECRFSNCTHTHEPGCAVLKALDEHYISQSRYKSYLSIREDATESKYR